MARVQYGTIVTEVKGKVQGQVFQGGNVGFVLRNKGYTKGLSSPARSGANINLSSIASAWRSLSDSERQEWQDIVSLWIFYNRFGAAYEGTGYQVFNAYNILAIPYNGYLYLFPEAQEAAVDPGVKVLTITFPFTLVFSFDNALTNSNFIRVYASAPVSQGRNTNHPRLKFIGFLYTDAVDSFDITAMYLAVYRAPYLGERIIIRTAWNCQEWMYQQYVSESTAIYTM